MSSTLVSYNDSIVSLRSNIAASLSNYTSATAALQNATTGTVSSLATSYVSKKSTFKTAVRSLGSYIQQAKTVANSL